MSLNGVLKLFGLQKIENTNARTTAPVTDRQLARPQPVPDAKEFQRRLAAMIKNCGSAAAGQIQFLGLEAIRNRIGDRWERLRDRVELVVRRSIEGALTQGEIYVPCDELKFLIVFAERDQDTAALRCAKILQSIHAALFGDDDTGVIEIQSLVSVVDEELVLESKSLDDCVRRISEKVGADGRPVTRHDAPAASGAAATDPQPDLQLTASLPVERTATRPNATPTRAPPAATTPHAPEPSRVVEQTATRPDTAHAGLVDQATSLEAPTAAPPAFAPPPAALSRGPVIDTPAPPAAALAFDKSVKFVYVPVWHAAKQAISGYHCVPSKETGSGTLFGYAAIYGRRSAVRSVDFDIMALRHSIELFTELLANSFEYLAVHSVNYETLKEPMRRRAYLASCHCIPLDLAPYQVIEIFGAPATVPTSRYTEMISELRPFFRNIILRISLKGEHLASAGSAGFNGFSVTVQDSPETAAGVREQLTKMAQKFKSLGVAGYALDVRSNAMLLHAADAGFIWAGGHFLMKPVEIPSHVVRYPRSNFETG